MNGWRHERTIDLSKEQTIGAMIRAAHRDAKSNEWIVHVLNNESDVDLSGYTARSAFLRSDGATVFADATIEGSTITAVLPSLAYSVAGSVFGTITLIADDQRITIDSLVIDVYIKSSEVVAPDDHLVLVSDQDLETKSQSLTGAINELLRKLIFKQDELVSGGNIKTINGETILGAGDIIVGSKINSVNGKTGDVELTPSDLGIGTVFTLKGSVATVDDLPDSGNEIGDVYYVIAESVGYIWLNDGTTDRWEQLGLSIDLSAYAKQADLDKTNEDLKQASDETKKAVSNLEGRVEDLEEHDSGGILDIVLTGKQIVSDNPLTVNINSKQANIITSSDQIRIEMPNGERTIYTVRNTDPYEWVLYAVVDDGLVIDPEDFDNNLYYTAMRMLVFSSENNRLTQRNTVDRRVDALKDILLQVKALLAEVRDALKDGDIEKAINLLDTFLLDEGGVSA